MISVKTPSNCIGPETDSVAPGYLILRVTMAGYDPFWRRLRFPAQFTLSHLHHVIQAVTLFGDYHLHHFIDKNGQLYAPEAKEKPLLFDKRPRQLEHETAAGVVLGQKGDTILYNYDFGDGWEFLITTEGLEPLTEGEAPHIICLGGEKAGPIEDCGGIGSFLSILKVLAGPDKKAKKKIAWMCEGYDPDHFDLEKTNLKLASFTRPRDAAPEVNDKPADEPSANE